MKKNVNWEVLPLSLSKKKNGIFFFEQPWGSTRKHRMFIYAMRWKKTEYLVLTDLKQSNKHKKPTPKTLRFIFNSNFIQTEWKDFAMELQKQGNSMGWSDIKGRTPTIMLRGKN